MGLRWAPIGVLCLGLLVTAVTTWFFHQAVVQRDADRFRNTVEGSCERIRDRLDTYTLALLSTRAHFASDREVSLREFRAFVEELEILERYPGIQGIGFSRRLQARDLARVEAELRAQGQEGFRVWPIHPRDEYHSIVYLEPHDRRNAASIGYDMFTEGVRREAMERARDRGEPALSGPVQLVQEIDQTKQIGFLLYVPIYAGEGIPATAAERREKLIGFVYSPFRVGDLFGRLFGSQSRPRVTFELHDLASLDGNTLIYSPESITRSPRFFERKQLPLFGRTWTIEFQTTRAFDLASSRNLTPYVFLAGLIVTMLLFLLTTLEARARAEAERQRNETEAQRANLHRLFMEAPAAIAILRGPDFRYELSNPLNEEVTEHRQLVGRTVKEALPEMAAQGILPMLEQVYRTGEQVVGKEVPIRMETADGVRQHYVNGIYQALRGADGRVEGVMVFGYDVTEQVLARKRVEEAVRARDDFLSVAGHELKTPLAALQLQVEALSRQLDRGDFSEPDRFRTKLDKMQAHVTRLERLIVELLDVSRISAGKLQLWRDEFDLEAVVHEVVERFQDQAARAGSEIQISSSGPIMGKWDRMRLDQVVTNIVSNAIKYGAGKPIHVSLIERGERVALEVRDRGIGIDPKDWDRIFGRFERAVSERNYGGLGLGLWLSRQIVEAHGGTIHFESELGAGTRFVIELPRTEERADA